MIIWTEKHNTQYRIARQLIAAHVTVALESPNDMNTFHCTDGNNGGQVYWPDPQSPYSRENLDCFGTEGKTYPIEVWTRYPGNMPYTGESANA